MAFPKFSTPPFGIVLLCVSILSGAIAGLVSCSSYEGNNTLETYPEKTARAQVARDVLLELIDFWDPVKQTQLVPIEHMVEIAAFLISGQHTHWVHDVATRSMNIRATGPFVDGTGYNTHQRVRIYYSNEVVDWLLAGRGGVIPDGAMIVKQMYPTDPANTSYGGDKVTGWAVMIRDQKASKDGWLWFLFFFPGSPSYGSTVLLSQYGMSFCLSCHEGADNSQGTFAALENLQGTENTYPPVVPPQQPGTMSASIGRAAHALGPGLYGGLSIDVVKRLHGQLRESKADDPKFKSILGGLEGGLWKAPAHLFETLQTMMDHQMDKPITAHRSSPNPAITSLFQREPIEKENVKGIPLGLTYDHVPVRSENPRQFTPAGNCRGCHDASQLLGGWLPHMMKEVAQKHARQDKKYNLSPFGEWGASMMGLAGRDPIFHAQLESEKHLRPEYAGEIEDLCLSCHQVMGQRQFHLDGNQEPFPAAMTYVVPGTQSDSRTVYGALARDGVSCTVCHQITQQGLGTEATFTGKFNVNEPPGTIFGPYPEADIKPLYMKKALGYELKEGAALRDPALCGSCHTVIPPVLPLGGAAEPRPFEDHRHSNEQTTYFEWKNSRYADEQQEEGCIGCHMPDVFDDEKLDNVVIANVENGYFPLVPNREDADKITPEPKTGYRRHTLVALNTFANEFFQQFSDVLGYATIDPGTPLTVGPSAAGAQHRLTLNQEEAMRLAGKTVALQIENVVRSGPGSQDLNVSVALENLTGHKFPSGVGFRRAFLRLDVLSSAGDVLWASGRTDAAGVIVNRAGDALASEFTSDWRELQPDYDRITGEDQVQVFETRHINLDQELTTSFLGLATEVKDNRLLPLGWRLDGPYGEITRPVSLGGEYAPIRTPGKRRIEYVIKDVAEAASVRATILYQSIPPYYLRDRFETPGPSSDRLYYIVSNVQFDDTPMAGWVLPVASNQVSVP